ncbi:MAG TPA: c-type cytochrome biogenesis protein CcmI [Acidobacteriota bacterium]|nr:c-type cytochrome biogenesis protein CcmI [Acidobacteriota bacterium]
MTVVLQALLILLVGAFVLTPLVRYRGVRIEREAAVVNRRRSIAERKTRLYTQLVELDFDRDSGKLGAEDHARMREETMNEVLQVLAEEERLGPAPAAAGASSAARASGAAGSAEDEIERMIEEMKRRRASVEASNA